MIEGLIVLENWLLPWFSLIVGLFDILLLLLIELFG